jgi:hypothetical protein
MSNRRYIFLAWILLGILPLPPVSHAGDRTGFESSIAATHHDLAVEARKVPLRGSLRLTGMDLDGIPGARDFELERFQVFTADARIFLDDSQIPVPDNRYFKGRIAGEPASRVLLTLRQSGELRGLVFRGGELWMLGGGAGSGIVAPGLVSRQTDPDLELADRTEGFRCLTDNLPMPVSDPEQTVVQTQSIPIQQGAGPTFAARVAIETDTEYFAHFGGAPAATDYAADLIAYSSTVFEDEVDTSLQISFLQLYSSSDPWDLDGCEVDLEEGIDEPFDRLTELKNHWQDAYPTEERTIVHMLSGKSDQCGISWIGVLCNDVYGFGLSGGLTYEFEINNPGIGWDIMVDSHVQSQKEMSGAITVTVTNQLTSHSFRAQQGQVGAAR